MAAPKKQLRPDDYTVAWVCALPIEKAAARFMMDESHEPPKLRNNPKGIYTFGRIHEHNVVIACQGIAGTAAAAKVATRMDDAFGNLRFGLLVGIAGGVPDKNDVRLGDVVVSKADGRSGGVVAHDRGKETTQGLELRSHVHGVPELLQNAFSELEASHLSQGNKIKQYFAEATERHPLFSKFQRPNLTDNLFEKDYDHVNPEDKKCDECSRKRIITREDRNVPVIHFGTVASGNQVIKSGTKRASIAEDNPGVLAIEMEASGLMDVFDFATIRGICDYADSHKNDGWHGYAAATAAAIAKEVLSIIPAQEVVAAPPMTIAS